MSVAIFGIGGVGFLLLLVFYQQALKTGLHLEPLIELRRRIEKKYPVKNLKATRTTSDNSSSAGTKKDRSYWIRIAFTPASRRGSHRKLAKQILTYTRNHYTGDRGNLSGIRVQVRSPEPEENRELFTMEEQIGPEEFESDR